jgi:hypothetical protein
MIELSGSLVWTTTIAWYTPGVMPVVLAVIVRFVLPSLATVPDVGATDSHGTSLNVGRPLSMR